MRRTPAQPAHGASPWFLAPLLRFASPLYRVGERAPPGGRDGQPWSSGVLGVADQPRGVGQGGHFDAVPARGTTPLCLDPFQAIAHRSSLLTLRIQAADSRTGSAAARSIDSTVIRSATSVWASTILPPR